MTDQLRTAIQNSGQTMYAIAKGSGINASVLSRFVTDRAQLRSDNFDTLCEYLGLELRPRSKAAKSKPKGK